MNIVKEEMESGADVGKGTETTAGAEVNTNPQNLNSNNNMKNVELDNLATTKPNTDSGNPTTTATKTSAAAAAKLLKKNPNDYIFGKLLGEGSFSSVYLAKDVKSHREYAIKVCEKKFILRENKAELIQREKEVMTILSRNPKKDAPYFVHLSATFQDPERLYFVMTYASGGELLKLLNKHETFDMEVCRFYAGEILQALRHLHSLKIVHRDLKPENILLNQHGHILLTDYGSAKIMPAINPTPIEPVQPVDEKSTNGEGDSTDGNTHKRTRRNSFVGTAQYVSPEILQGKYSIVGPPVDLWAFGCVVYQFLTGSSPFSGPNEFLIFQKIIKLQYEFPSGFDAHAQNLVSNLLILEPSERLGSNDSELYTSIQSHEFFGGINLDELHSQPPPSIWPSSPLNTPSTNPNQQPNIPDHFEPGFNPRVIAERILRSDGDLPMEWGNVREINESKYETKVEQVTLKVDLPSSTKKSESSFSNTNDAGVLQDKSDSPNNNKNPSTRCYCC